MGYLRRKISFLLFIVIIFDNIIEQSNEESLKKVRSKTDFDQSQISFKDKKRTIQLKHNNSCNATKELPFLNDALLYKSRNERAASEPTDSMTVFEAPSKSAASVLHSDTQLIAVQNLTDHEIHEYAFIVDDSSLAQTANKHFARTLILSSASNETILGAVFTRDNGGHLITKANLANIINSHFVAGAYIDQYFFENATRLTILISNSQKFYTNKTNSADENIASCFIIAQMMRPNNTTVAPVEVNLYFQVVNEYRPRGAVQYLCSYYNDTSLTWDDTDCTKPRFKSNFDRYECNCMNSHGSLFALIWRYNSSYCQNSTHVLLFHSDCVPRSEAQGVALNALRNVTSSSGIATALSSYISIVSNAPVDMTYALTVEEIDMYLASISNTNITINNNDSFLMALSPDQGDRLVLGASFTRGTGGELINNVNLNAMINTTQSIGACIREESLGGVTSLNMLIIDKPTLFERIDNSTGSNLASSVAIIALSQNSTSAASVTIDLYFQVLKEYRPTVAAEYACAYFDHQTSKWSSTGCTVPYFDTKFERFQCSCNHLSSFALIWLPKTQLTHDRDAQDIASIVFLSISILCFLSIILHAIFMRFRHSSVDFQVIDFVPMVSCAVTMIFFVFFITLATVVYIKTPSNNDSKCYVSSKVLMFIVYFCLILMFCTKTSVGYFHYVRFVRQFTQPSNQRLVIMLSISVFISIACTTIAVGLDSSSSYRITELYPFKLCWFSGNVIYYFVLIPASLFLFTTLIIFILVVYHLLQHAKRMATLQPSNQTIRRCLLVILSSCVTQGINWVFGPFVSFLNKDAAYVFGWIFIIFNGLEGLWSIVLYIIVLMQQRDRHNKKYLMQTNQRNKNKRATSRKYEASNDRNYGTKSLDKQKSSVDKHTNRHNESSSPYEELDDNLATNSTTGYYLSSTDFQKL